MIRYFKTLDEQLNILEKRGLIIKNRERAKENLLMYNYYKLINGTYKFFSDDKNKDENYKYYENTKFEDLIAVHNFDKELKKIALKSMLEIERIARSIISYKFVEKYPENDAYLNIENYNTNDRTTALDAIEKIKSAISQYSNEENYNRSMNYYMKKYGSIPFWFIVNFISFGGLVRIFNALDYKLKEDIADIFQKFLEENLQEKIKGFLTPSQLESFLENAKDLRNISAHDNILLGYKFDEIEFFSPIHEKYGISKEENRDTLFDTFIVLQALLPKKDYKEVENQIKNSIETLKNSIASKPFYNVIKSIGYMEN